MSQEERDSQKPISPASKSIQRLIFIWNLLLQIFPKWMRLSISHSSQIGIDSYILLVAGVGLATLLRYSFRNFETRDYQYALSPWYDFIIQNGGWLALKKSFSDYSPAYLYLLVIAASLKDVIPKIVSIKLISIIFDFICAYLIAEIVRLKYPIGRIPSIAFLFVLLTPTIFINGSLWGQCDVIYTSGLIAAIYCILLERKNFAFIAVGIAISFKLQAIFILPLLLILYFKRFVSWRSFCWIPLTFLTSLLPAWLIGRSIQDLLGIYINQSKVYADLTRNAPNLYQWLPNQYYEIFYPAGVIFASAVVCLLLLVICEGRSKLTQGNLVKLSLLSVLLMPYILPKMHDRYFFAADVISIIYGFWHPRYFFVPVVIQLVSLFTYFPYLFNMVIIPFPFLALILGALLIFVFYDVIRELRLDSGSFTLPLK